MSHEIFISYSMKNKNIAEAVCFALEKQNINCWIAPRDVTPGIKYAEAIIDAINECQVFLLILSTASNQSHQVEMEVDRAACKEIPILSFRIEPVELTKTMEYYLSSFHWLDALEPPIENHINTLVQTVSRLVKPAENNQVVKQTGIDYKEKFIVAKQIDESQVQVRRTSESEVKITNLNPFTFGNPIKDSSRFFGREADIRLIINRLLTSAHESTSIIGERRIGKTSLLYYLSLPDVYEKLGLTPDKFCLVYVDFQGLTDITPTRFWQRILKKMARSIYNQDLRGEIELLIQQNDIDLFDLEDLFEAVSDDGLTTVLLMDEFEYVTQNPNFKSDFFGGLRALAIHHGVSLIPATRRELVDLCHSDEIKGSPFFNIFANIILRPFSFLEVKEMVTQYMANTSIEVADDELELIWQLGGGYPFFIQMAGNFLLEGKIQKKTRQDLREFTIKAFEQQADAHFSYFWSHCTDSEKITLLVLLALDLQKISEKSVSTLEYLSSLRSRTEQDLGSLGKKGIVIEQNGLYSIFSISFTNWIYKEIPAKPGEYGDMKEAEEWLKSTGNMENLSPSDLTYFQKKYWQIISEYSQEPSLKSIMDDPIGVLSSPLTK